MSRDLRRIEQIEQELYLRVCCCSKDGSRAEIYLKREDLNHTGAHKINNSLGQALLCLRMNKRRIIAETGAGQHGVATVSSLAPDHSSSHHRMCAKVSCATVSDCIHGSSVRDRISGLEYSAREVQGNCGCRNCSSWTWVCSAYKRVCIGFPSCHYVLLQDPCINIMHWPCS